MLRPMETQSQEQVFAAQCKDSAMRELDRLGSVPYVPDIRTERLCATLAQVPVEIDNVRFAWSNHFDFVVTRNLFGVFGLTGKGRALETNASQQAHGLAHVFPSDQQIDVLVLT